MEIGFNNDEVLELCASRLAHERAQEELDYERVFEKHRRVAIDELSGKRPQVLRQALAAYVWHGLPQMNVRFKEFSTVLDAAEKATEGCSLLDLKPGTIIETALGRARVITWKTALSDPAVEKNVNHIPVEFIPKTSSKEKSSFGAIPQEMVQTVVQR